MSTPTQSVTEIAPSTWRLASRLGGRNVFQYLLGDQDGGGLLIDTGTARTPHEVIMPALRHLGLAATAVQMVLVSHPDADHQGGLSALREELPRARFACGFEDIGLVSSPERLLRERYGAYLTLHGVGYGEGELASLRSLCGDPTEIDFGLVGGERLELGDRALRVYHAPGHSAGHLVIHEPLTGLLFSGDAVHWRMIPAADGTPALPPTYEEVDAYLATVAMIEAIAPSHLHSGHWPMLAGSEIRTWLAESRSFVFAVEEIIRECVASAATLREVCMEVDRRLGPFGADPVNLMFIVHGHLRRLMRSGTASLDLGQDPPLFRRESET